MGIMWLMVDDAVWSCTAHAHKRPVK